MASRKNSKAKQSGKKNTEQIYKGRLDITRKGSGYVIVPGEEQDIFIRPENLADGMHGDEVSVTLLPSGRRHTRPEGQITSVISRKQQDFSGILEVYKHHAFLIPDNKNLHTDIFIPLHLLHDGKNGDRAAVRVLEWNGNKKNPVGEVTHILTNESANEIAMQGILMENGFPLHFPDDVLEEAARYNEGASREELLRRKDLREVLTLTIDPADAKDFDDALSFSRLKGGGIEIGVHIADVSHYVRAGSALDEEAYRRATSVYLPDRVLPMLPERLSNELCSLRPGEDKYAFSVLFRFTRAGRLKDHWMGKTIIRSDRRFTYEEAQEIIEGAPGEHAQTILTLHDIARKFREERFAKGAINFSSREIRFKLDESAKPIGIVIKESKEANQLIEEFMLLANRTVAEYISGLHVKNKPVPFPYRVHDLPDEDKLRQFSVFAARFGYRFDVNSPAGIARSFNEMLQLVKDKPEQQVLESLGIRTMAKAVYSNDNIGHYGLGFAHYCHFTSPIRRYPDILVHRILQEALQNEIKPVKQMETWCRHCSSQERNAMDSERSANKYKQVEYMQPFVGEDFDAVITGVSAYGFWAETVLHKCEGMVSAQELQLVDMFELLEEEYTLKGRHTGIRFRMGDKVRIRVVRASLEKRQLDYTLAEMPDQKPARKAAKAKKTEKKTRKAGKR